MLTKKKSQVKETQKESPRPTRQRPSVEEYDEPDTTAEENEGGEDEPKSKSSNKSFAQKFDAIVSSSSGDADVPKGAYEAIISEAVLQKANAANGQSVRLRFELCDPDYNNKNVITQWFKIKDADGEPFEVGCRMLNQALAKIGYQLKFDDLEEILGEISSEKPGVIINVSYSEGKTGRIFTNAVIQNTCDNEIVQEYKDNVAY